MGQNTEIFARKGICPFWPVSSILLLIFVTFYFNVKIIWIKKQKNTLIKMSFCFILEEGRKDKNEDIIIILCYPFIHFL